MDEGRSMTRNGLMVTIIVPVYNERETVAHVVQRVLEIGFHYPLEVVIVDDGSTDGTMDELRSLTGSNAVRPHVVTLPVNCGKGVAVRSGIAFASGTHVLIFD